MIAVHGLPQSVLSTRRRSRIKVSNLWLKERACAMLAQQFADNNFSAVWAATELMLRPGPVHPRINRTLRLIPERLEALQDVSLKTLADLSGLSTSRFMHLFTEAAGVPLRPYILRLRLQRACVELLAGTTVTSAACSAGFSDASHLTRTF